MSESSSSSNNIYAGNFTANSNSQNGNADIDNMHHAHDNDAGGNNILNRNNVTVRDHLFQAMFSRIALTYDRTFPPFARRFIEFMLLLTAISVLVILIYIHMAFVKSPITCLDHFAFNENMVHDSAAGDDDGAMKHMVIRVEVLSDPPHKYSLYHSYGKEYDDLSRLANADSTNASKTAPATSEQRHSQLALFLSIIRKQCATNHSGSGLDGTDRAATGKSHLELAKEERNKAKEPDGYFSQLFNFPINPILEKAEYWRERLSGRAMAPFRQTFNELELFAKSVFTEEKYIMEYSLEYGLLRLTPQTRERLNIPVHFVLLDSSKDKCFGNAFSRFLLQEFIGYDQIIIGSLKRLAERHNGKGYVRNVVSGEHYRFVNSWMSRTSYLAAGFIMIIFTLSVSMLLRYSHHQIFVFIVDLLRMLENNLQFSFPAAPLLTVVLALVGMEAIMSEFFNDTSTAFYTILIIWLADQYEAVCCRTYVSKRHWPKYFYLYHFAFYAYHYRFNGQFSGLALLCSWLFIQHSMFFFFHHYELPRLMHGIAVRAIMDSLIVERADNASLTPSSIFPNDDDNDRSDGDRYDNDDGPGSSNTQHLAPSGESHEEREHKSDSRNEEAHSGDQPRENHTTHSHNTRSRRYFADKAERDNKSRGDIYVLQKVGTLSVLGLVASVFYQTFSLTVLCVTMNVVTSYVRSTRDSHKKPYRRASRTPESVPASLDNFYPSPAQILCPVLFHPRSSFTHRKNILFSPRVISSISPFLRKAPIIPLSDLYPEVKQEPRIVGPSHQRESTPYSGTTMEDRHHNCNSNNKITASLIL